MNTLTRIIVSSLIALLLVSCNFNDSFFGMGVKGNGNVISTQRQVSTGFSAIEVSRGLDLYITQSSSVSLEVEADENLQDIIITEVIDNVLKIYAEENISTSTSKKVFLNVTNISRIEASSGSDVYTTNTLIADELNLESTSGSDMEIEVEANTINCNSTSGSDLRLSGTTIVFNAEASSGSDIKASKLIAQQSKVRASSGADISIHTTEALDAKASSGGDITYYGNPVKVSSNEGSSGQINKE